MRCSPDESSCGEQPSSLILHLPCFCSLYNGQDNTIYLLLFSVSDLYEYMHLEGTYHKRKILQVINFTESHLYVCTDEIAAWRVGIAEFHGSIGDTPVEHWVAVLSQDTTTHG